VKRKSEIKAGFFYEVYTDTSGTVSVYWQTKNVSICPNPPKSAKYFDHRHRTKGEGYADYDTEFVFFDPDEVLLVPENSDSSNNTLPRKHKSFGDLVKMLIPPHARGGSFRPPRGGRGGSPRPPPNRQ
jgi:hypothetical protein